MSKKAQKKAEIEKIKKRREERAIEKAQHEEEMYSQVKGKNDEEDGRSNFTLRNAPQPQTSDLPTYVFAHIGITFPVSSKAWALATVTLSLRTMATSKMILAHFRTPGMQKFHFDQSKFRSEIRLREGRTKPIDVLLKNLNFADEEKEALKKLKAEERLRKVLMLLATFAITITYVDGLSTPGGFWDPSPRRCDPQGPPQPAPDGVPALQHHVVHGVPAHHRAAHRRQKASREDGLVSRALRVHLHRAGQPHHRLHRRQLQEDGHQSTWPAWLASLWHSSYMVSSTLIPV